MASSPPEIHQAAQSVIASQIPEAVATAAWSQFDPGRINATMPRLTLTVMGLLRRFGLASAVQAASFYKQQRLAAGIPGRFVVPLAPTASPQQVEKEIRWAVNDLYDAATPAADVAAPAAREPIKKTPSYDLTRYIIKPEAEQAALTKVQGVVEKLALDQSRDTLLNAVESDREALGWARVPEAGACSFCLLLATRGAVYKTAETAGPNVRGKRNANAGVAFKGDGLFKVHDHCRCHVEPLFSAMYEPTAQVRAAQALYKESARAGSSGALNNFRVAVQKARDAGQQI